MRSRVTAVVLVGLVGIGVAAAVDAVLARGDQVTQTTTDAQSRREAVTALHAAGVRGVLTYSDEECDLHAVRLPSLASAPAPAITSCEPHIPTGGIGTWQGEVVWSGFGYGVAQVVLPAERIDRTLGERFRVDGLDVRARQAVDLGRQRYVVIAVDEGEDQYVAFFDDRRLLIAHRLPAGTEDDVLRPSPRGHYVALLTPGAPGVSVFTRAGTRVALPPVASPRTIAWSPDDDWTALATLDSVYIFRSHEDESTLPRIPLAVRDLDWDA